MIFKAYQIQNDADLVMQVILGRSSVDITMNLFCHVTKDSLISEVSKFEAEEPEKGVNQQIGSKKSLHQVV